MTEDFYKKLKEQSGELGILLDDEKISQLFLYYEMLVEKNKVMNLTAITEEDDVITKHFVDSMAIIKAEQYVSRETLEKGCKIIDVGTGAGFPGLVLKIVFPNLQMTLSDSLKKRLNFLEEVIETLGLKGVECVHGRAEDLGRNLNYREQYDIATSRAVANLSVLAEYDMPFVKKGGYFLPYKAGDIAQEKQSAQKAVEMLGGKIEEVIAYSLPESDISRSIIAIRKTRETPKKYPRKAGTPTKEPL